MMKVFAIMKSDKYVKDFTDGEELTTSFTHAEKYTNEKSALIAAQQYGRMYGKGFKVVKMQ